MGEYSKIQLKVYYLGVYFHTLYHLFFAFYYVFCLLYLEKLVVNLFGKYVDCYIKLINNYF